MGTEWVFAGLWRFTAAHGYDRVDLALSCFMLAGLVSLILLILRNFSRGNKLHDVNLNKPQTPRRPELHAEQKLEGSAALRGFQRTYLVPYLLCTFADWIQGPYQYAVYAANGYSESDIAFLYVFGFGGSFVFGTLIASCADRFGRRNNCLIYCALYSASCLCISSKQYSVLVLGRLLGGISTSILNAAFESWCITEFRAQCAENPALQISNLDTVFTNATFANALTAIVASLAGDVLVRTYGTPVAPFNAVSVVLALAAVLIARNWRENYGNREEQNSIRAACVLIRADKRLPLIGIMSAFFEAALYVFIFLWTPVLERAAAYSRSLDESAVKSDSGDGIPHGIVFGAFMCWKMVGSLLCKEFVAMDPEAKVGVRPDIMLVWVIAFGGAGLLVPCVARGFIWNLLGFTCFELAIGVYWPCIMLLRSNYLREEERAATTSLFRLPLNAMVCFVLFDGGQLSDEHKFGLCSGFLLVSIFCQQRLTTLIGAETVDISVARKDILSN